MASSSLESSSESSTESSPEPLELKVSPPETAEERKKRLESLKLDPTKMTLEELKEVYDDMDVLFSMCVNGIIYKNKAMIKFDEDVAEYRKYCRGLGPFGDRSKAPPIPLGLLGGIHNYQICDYTRPRLVRIVKAALDKYNAENQGANFELEELLWANAEHLRGLRCYVTFKAKDKANGTTHTFQAKVFDVLRNMVTDVLMCQMIPN